MSSAGLHHIHKRKRSRSRLDPYPHPNKFLNNLDKFLIFTAIANPLTAIPQMYQIYQYRSSTGVSIITWLLGAVFSVPWLVYGIVHRERSHIISYTMWTVFNLIIVALILIYP